MSLTELVGDVSSLFGFVIRGNRPSSQGAVCHASTMMRRPYGPLSYRRGT
jgi:hypothetical protein